jgi:hypothetical protein
MKQMLLGFLFFLLSFIIQFFISSIILTSKNAIGIIITLVVLEFIVFALLGFLITLKKEISYIGWFVIFGSVINFLLAVFVSWFASLW